LPDRRPHRDHGQHGADATRRQQDPNVDDRVAHQVLHEGRQQCHRRQQDDADDEDAHQPDAKVAVPEQGWLDERMLVGKDVRHEHVQRNACEQRLDHDLGVAEPVERFTSVQHHLQCPDGQAEQREAEQVEASGMIDRRLVHKRRQPEPGQQAERQVDVEDPAPVVVLGQPATERRPEYGPDHHAHAPHRHGRPVPLARVGVQEHRLRQRH
jgi:hypothetical protein